MRKGKRPYRKTRVAKSKARRGSMSKSRDLGRTGYQVARNRGK